MAVINGTFNADVLNGTTVADTIDGSFGNDTIDGRAGNDRLIGDWDDDRILGGAGNDTIIGDASDFGDSFGNDTILAGDGDDDVYSWRGRDSIDGGAGNDFINAWTESNTVFGGAGNDTIIAIGPFADYLDGGPGNDRIESGDSFYTQLVPPFPNGSDTLLGGGGADVFVANGPDELNGDLFLDFDSDDLIILNGPVFAGRTIAVPGGNVFIDINPSATSELFLFFANLPAGTFFVTPRAATFSTEVSFVRAGPSASQTGTAGNDSLTGSNTLNDTLVGLAGNDTLTGLAGTDSLVGGNGTDSLLGGAGTDTLNGGAGIDTLVGGTGNDRLIGGTGADLFRWTAVAFAGGDVSAGGIDTVVAVPADGDRLDFTAAIEALLEVNNVSLAAATGIVAIGGAFVAGRTNVRFDAASDRLQFDLNGNAGFDAGDFQIALTGINSVTYRADTDLFLLA